MVTIAEPVPTLPGRYYRDPSIFALEQERLFATSWTFVGRADSIPAAGDYFLAANLHGNIFNPIELRTFYCYTMYRQ